MKKIVALVLSLVMVLGLATTAFGATTSTGSVSTTSVTPVKASMYALVGTNNYDSMTELGPVTEIKLTTVSGKVVNDVPMYVPNVYSISFTEGAYTWTGDLYIEVAKADATHALKNNGAWVYLFNVNENELTNAAGTGAIDVWATDVAIDSLVLSVADETIDCGDCVDKYPNATKTCDYYVSGDDFYYAFAGAKFAYFNGQFVKYDAVNKVAFQAHKWDYTTVVVRDTDTKGVKVPVTVECEECEKNFPVVGIAKFDNTWVKGVNYDDFDAAKVAGAVGPYFIVLDEVTAVTPDAPAAGDKVESAQTFDAGIAMYVGMSVMAAAGSAVVLKKKD